MKFIKTLKIILIICFIIGIMYYFITSWFVNNSTSTELHKILINNKTFYIRSTVGGIGGTIVYSIGSKKRKGWKFNQKTEIYLRTHDLKPCYYKVINDTLLFFSSEKLTIPKKMINFPLRQYPLEEIKHYKDTKIVHSYTEGF